MKTKFAVYCSKSITYLRILMAAMVVLTFWEAYIIKLTWLYGVGVLCLAMAAWVYAMLGATVTFSETGVCHNQIGRKIVMTWDEVAFVQTAVLTPMGFNGPVRSYIFAKSPIDPHTIETSKSLPTASNNMVFVTEQPHLLDALKTFVPVEKQKNML